MDKKLLISMVGILFTCFACSACSWVNKKLGLKDDNLIEEMAEEVVKEKTGVDVDFTPETPE